MNKILIGVFCLVTLATAFPTEENAPTSNLNLDAQPVQQPAIDPIPVGEDGAQGVATEGEEEGDVGSRHWGGHHGHHGYGGYGGYGGHHGGYGHHGGHHGGYGGYGGYGRPYGGYGGYYG